MRKWLVFQFSQENKNVANLEVIINIFYAKLKEYLDNFEYNINQNVTILIIVELLLSQILKQKKSIFFHHHEEVKRNQSEAQR